MAQAQHDMAELTEVAHALADAAGAAIQPYFRTKLTPENKDAQGFDPVTIADRAAEAAMRDVLAIRRPQDGIYGEEYGRQDGTSGLTWVLDPIDGTRAFICGAPTWGCLIGLDDGSGPILGIVDQPHTGERFFGGPNGATLTHHGITTSLQTNRATTALSGAKLLTTFPEVGQAAERAAFERVRDQVQLTRYGLDCYAYALIATGQVDLVIEAGLNAYDIQGPQAVIEAAGGIVTTWDGGPAHQGGRILAAGNKALHQAAMDLLNS
ncbi:histidinol phosphatase-like enzyme (inositol monophosphatase family) [Rubricella aquisinus]|uniref:Histidinol-phosphatase n=1 Tax=Rubricella aquisinus TaxID=2028108 RepID=A0A840WMT3_9RHOB|nr:histidinol-phosphatase [Rubricella aquisinus]MBB5515403.1 histidinol phosphatase-like enzyme (inositol monophosphatase family) [Rubricella aquisinus]